MVDYPINPRAREIDDKTFHRSIVNIFDSYHAPEQDLLVEMVQNSIDALEERGEIDPTYDPLIDIKIDTANSTIEVFDNGVGMPEKVIEGLGSPHNTTKIGKRRRGHKGVGLTYAAWSTKKFQFATKKYKGGEIEAGILEEGSKWIDEGGKCPLIEEDLKFAKKFPSDQDYGTLMRFELPNSSKALSTIKRLSIEGLAILLKTKTAIGYVNLPYLGISGGGKEDWINRCKVHVEIDGIRVPISQLGYQYPHMMVSENKSASLDFLKDLDPATQRRHEGKKKFIYNSLDRDKVLSILESNTDWHDLAEFAREQNVVAYCAFADQKSTITDLNNSLYRPNPGSGKKKIIIGPGIQVVTASMPVGRILDLPLKFGTGNSNRFIGIIEFDNVKPDYGRKTFHENVDDISRIIMEYMLSKELVPNRDYTIPHETAHGETETEQFESLENFLKEPDQRVKLQIQSLGIRNEPKFEQEVAGLYHALLASKHLRGVSVLASPGSTSKYDAILEMNLTSEENEKMVAELRVSESEFPPKGGPVRFSKLITEYKLQASSVVEDFDMGEKDASDIDILVCWSLGRSDAFQPAGNPIHPLEHFDDPIQIPGQTHRLESGGKKIKVIALKDVIRKIAASGHASLEIARVA